MEDCLFCKIVAGKIPSQTVYQDDQVFAFRDINPQAPVHVLIIPKTHITAVSDITKEHIPLLGHMVVIANQIAQSEGIFEKGYRLAINCGKEGGQAVAHLHIHLLGGRQMSGKLG